MIRYGTLLYVYVVGIRELSSNLWQHRCLVMWTKMSIARSRQSLFAAHIDNFCQAVSVNHGVTGEHVPRIWSGAR